MSVTRCGMCGQPREPWAFDDARGVICRECTDNPPPSPPRTTPDGPAPITRATLCAELGLTYNTLRAYERYIGDLLSTRPGSRRRGGMKEALRYTENDRALLHRAVHAHREARVPYRRLRAHLVAGDDKQEQLDRIEAMLAHCVQRLDATEERYQALAKRLKAQGRE